MTVSILEVLCRELTLLCSAALALVCEGLGYHSTELQTACELCDPEPPVHAYSPMWVYTHIHVYTNVKMN